MSGSVSGIGRYGIEQNINILALLDLAFQWREADNKQISQIYSM